MVNQSPITGCPDCQRNRGVPVPTLSNWTTCDVLVIGYGNSLRGDDGLGLVVAEQLSSAVTCSSVRVVATHQLTFDMAEMISRARSLILIDAAHGPTPGQIKCQPITPQPSAAFTMLHHMEADALLACALAIYGAVPSAALWTIAGASFDYGSTLSAPVQSALPDFLTRLRRTICAHCAAAQG